MSVAGLDAPVVTVRPPASDRMREHRGAVVADVTRAVDLDHEAIVGAHIGVARAADGHARRLRVQVREIGVARPVERHAERLGSSGERDVGRAVGPHLECAGLDAVGVDVAGSGRLDARQLRHRRLDDDVIAAPAVMVERDLERAVVHLGPYVVDHLLAGPDLDALLLADAEPYVDGAAVVDLREGADVAGLRGAWTVVGEVAAGDREGGERAGEEEEERAWGGHDPMVGVPRRSGHRGSLRGVLGLTSATFDAPAAWVDLSMTQREKAP